MRFLFFFALFLLFTKEKLAASNFAAIKRDDLADLAHQLYFNCERNAVARLEREPTPLEYEIICNQCEEVPLLFINMANTPRRWFTKR
ncbi:Oidioi.mRNA.OKI2018_I69.chr1.g122.t1.cds [Oikopleura dioica]|uniref:Oidioi.mRNA.OKI2018_I69.chr1.g122.t1.cds n=1 Tax=Oikopleura dioica TaxID=34765 RepID=A0ABN7SN39_OIKDI|nr:Oidioi.mRNA.OKI2018_I69.chr1.g122.t1.cds [Oikopleura dioica]